MTGPYDYVPPNYWLMDTQAGGAFGPANPNGNGGAIQARRPTADAIQNAKIEFRKWVAAAPELSQAIQQVTAIAIGVRLDESGNAAAGVRVAINKELTDELVGKSQKTDVALPNSASHSRPAESQPMPCGLRWP